MSTPNPLECAVNNRMEDAVDLLLQLGAKTSSHAMYIAVKNDDLNCLKLLIRYITREPSDDRWAYLLFTACVYASHELIKELLRHGARITNIYKLAIAIRKGYTDVVKVGLDAYKYDKRDLNRVLYIARDVETLRVLISHGADIETTVYALYSAIRCS
jgi:ankyrin repeat protein